MDSEILIKKYLKEDLDQIIDIWLRASLIAHNFVPEYFWESEKDNIINNYLPKSDTYVAFSGGEPVGFISLLDSYIGGLFIHPEKQGKGIGTALVDHVRKMKPNLTVGVFDKNDMAKRFYTKYGFIKTKESIMEATGEIVIDMELKENSGEKKQ